jgi:hypothetical protein
MNTEASLNNPTGSSRPKPVVGCPWAGKEIENPTQTHVWRGLLASVVLSRPVCTDQTASEHSHLSLRSQVNKLVNLRLKTYLDV